MKFLREWGIFVLVLALYFLSRTFLWSPVIVSGPSMDPTLADGQRLILLKTERLERFDIVVAEENDDNGDKKDIIKRIVGLPGDKISYKDDILTINGQKYDEPYLDDYKQKLKTEKLQKEYSFNSEFQEWARETKYFTLDKDFNSEFEVTVPQGKYYLLGDNRLISEDSRRIGSVDKKDILGKVKFRVWPFKSIGTVN